jgi:hypothetical protein
VFPKDIKCAKTPKLILIYLSVDGLLMGEPEI